MSRKWIFSAISALVLMSWSVVSWRAVASPAPSSALQAGFERAAREFHVPLPILLGVSYTLSRWDDHQGRPSTSGGYGVMHLTDADARRVVTDKGDRVRIASNYPALHTLERAAALIHVSPATLRSNIQQNVRGGAALLAHLAGMPRPTTLLAWYDAVERYSGFSDPVARTFFADTVFDTIRRGMARRTLAGQIVHLRPQPVSTPHHSRTAARSNLPKPECPTALPCHFVPAAYQVNDPRDPTDYGNYDPANRNGNEPVIRTIVIHDTEESYASTINEFRNPTAYVSAHYVVRSGDGDITQMVQTKNIAWHAGNYYYNMHAIGIEHEGVAIEGPTWYTEIMYQASARLVRYLAGLYHIPLDRAHIIGHDQVPGPAAQFVAGMHWDPGTYWDWEHYMALLNAPLPQPGGTQLQGVLTLAPGFIGNQQTVTYCTNAQCQLQPPQGSNFVPLYTAPSSNAPLLSDRALHPKGESGTTQANDWGDKAVAGQQFYQVDRQGDWVKIDYGGQEAWLNDPTTAPVAATGTATLVTPKKGVSSIPVYGRAYPEASAYPASITPETVSPLQYTIPAGQKYVVVDKVMADFYWSPTQKRHAVIHGVTKYDVISFNHRLALVKASDVDIVSSSSR